MGAKKIPENVSILWMFDEKNVVVTVANGDVATKSQYTLRSDGEHQIISLSEDGKKEPNRIGWYEFKDGKLRMQLMLDSGKPPDKWDEDKVMVFEPAAE